MNSNNVKNFATWARTHLLEAITRQAAVYGIKASGIDEVRETGDAVIINGTVFDRRIRQQRARLVEEVKSRGFEQVIDEVAYTWFNRLCALRFMEVNDYLPTGIRVLSSSDDGKTEPDVLTQALSVNLSINKDEVYRLLDSHKEDELYRRLLIAQCNALNEPLPFLFEKISDYTELLLPEGLLHPGGLIDKLVSDIPEDDWREIEIVGWLYQFYIKDKKDQVIGKVVKKEDIPAATQLFTPRWIVEYMVQNSLGRLWLEMYPDSPLRGRMKYYIENPDDKDLRRKPMPLEEIKCLDNACGSGHILVVMFDLLFQMYEERGYVGRDIPALILKHNITGIDIDRRACQLAAFAVAMKAREKDRRFFDRKVEPQVIEILESNGLDPEIPLRIQKRELAALAVPTDADDVDMFSGARPRQTEVFEAAPEPKCETVTALTALFDLFRDAKNFGSLLTVPGTLVEQLPALRKDTEEWKTSGDTFTADFAMRVLPLVNQAKSLAEKYSVIVANPPYFDRYNGDLHRFAGRAFPESKANAYSMFMERNLVFASRNGYAALVTMQGWMFLSSYDGLRSSLLSRSYLTTMAHLGPRAFDSISGEVVLATTFVLRNSAPSGHRSTFIRLVEGGCESEKEQMLQTTLQSAASKFVFRKEVPEFSRIPGAPLAYWASERQLQAFDSMPKLGERVDPRSGMATGDNERFLRLWHEVGFDRVGLGMRSRDEARNSSKHWFPYNKGGAARKWYGNNDILVLFHNDGELIKKTKEQKLAAGLITPNNSKCWNQECYFLPCLTWSALSRTIAVRQCPAGFIFDTKGQSIFVLQDKDLYFYNGFLNSVVAAELLEILTPTLDFNSGYLRRLPDCYQRFVEHAQAREIAKAAVSLAAEDWDTFETSWDFTCLGLLSPALKCSTLELSWDNWSKRLFANTAIMRGLETENNRLWIEAYGLQDELSPEVPEEEITLARPDLGRDMAAFVSYTIGCMMGRYSLDKPGLILAEAGDTLKEYVEKVGKPLEEIAFPADKDAIIPVLDAEYFSDDCAGRLIEFMKITFGPHTLDENLDFLADALVSRKKNENSRDAIRRYLATQFFKDHCQTYKNRPIYWMFTSGKERAFQALVYMHRYRPDTIARMRTEYLHELQKKLEWEEGHLEDAAEAGGKTGRDAEKKLKTLRAQLKELKAYDEKLRHYAEMQIDIDLDDGVKVNYRKFKELLAPVQGVTTGKDED